MEKTRLKKYANLIAVRGVNVQKNQPVVISAPVYCHDFVQLLTEALYKQKASQVFVDYYDPYIQKLKINHESQKILSELPDYLVSQAKYRYDRNVCRISLSSPDFNASKGLNFQKLRLHNKALEPLSKYTHEPFLASLRQWCVVAVPNEKWAKKVFPNLSCKKAMESLWDEIFKAVHITKENDPVKEWEKHDAMLKEKGELLNQYQFEKLKYFSSNGTNFEVGLVEKHIWIGGADGGENNIPVFDANMPTEEVFTMPHKDKVNGKVVATKPLLYQGHLIEDFYLVFKDGKVIEAQAKKGQDALQALLDTDEGSRSLGEVALVPYHSPISLSGILFYNTLFDENASCHLALGEAYVTNIENGVAMSQEELYAKGYNHSLNHVDFMIGSKDMKIVGVLSDQTEVTIFENGDYAI